LNFLRRGGGRPALRFTIPTTCAPCLLEGLSAPLPKNGLPFTAVVLFR
jgi:hypothetical protein